MSQLTTTLPTPAAACGQASRRPSDKPEGARERGTVTIELVVAVPLLVAACLLLVQGLVVVSGLGAIGVAAKDAARAVASVCSPDDPQAAAKRAVPDFVKLEPVKTSTAGSSVTAEVTGVIKWGFGAAPVETRFTQTATLPRLASCH
ncbi:MAG: hypothetical protein LBR32_00855 [Propionibacteriaceae bacterium]|jgi:Flp pilus assembly protein TadG|nr:hypothetical protein [Propionibacteriaceae bacterium]